MICEQCGEPIKDSEEYAEVNQRIKAFRMVYPTGSIETDLLSNENGVCIFKATVWNGDTILGEGTAYEKEGSSFINKTSYIENCETSAVGRALGMAGFGIDTSIASAEEVQNAIEQQKGMEKINETQLKVLQEVIKTTAEPKAFYEAILDTYKIKELSELTLEQHGKILLEIKKLKGE